MEEEQKVLAFSETVLRERIREGVQHLRSPRQGLFWTLTLEMANAYRRAYIDWCERSMKLLHESMLDGGQTAIERGLADEGAGLRAV
jgi:hypothetical protein